MTVSQKNDEQVFTAKINLDLKFASERHKADSSGRSLVVFVRSKWGWVVKSINGSDGPFVREPLNFVPEPNPAIALSVALKKWGITIPLNLHLSDLVEMN